MDDAEFWEFYARYRGIALRAAKTILKNEAEAEDVCQDIFETLYHMEQDKVNRQTMGAMIREMSVNRAKDYCKKDCSYCYGQCNLRGCSNAGGNLRSCASCADL